MTDGPLVYLTRAAVRDRDRDARYHFTRSAVHPIHTVCGGQRVADEGGRDAGEVPDDRRCYAAGCRDRWRGIAGQVDLFTTEEDRS